MRRSSAKIQAVHEHAQGDIDQSGCRQVTSSTRSSGPVKPRSAAAAVEGAGSVICPR